MFRTDFNVESDILIVGDPIPGDDKTGTYVEIENPRKGLWGIIPVFSGSRLKSVFFVARERSKVNTKLDEEYTVYTPSGHIGAFDINYFINDGSNEEYEDTIIDLCNVERKCSGYIEGGAVARPHQEIEPEMNLLVSRNYKGEAIEIIVYIKDRWD